jgi:hypothetical protein
MPFNANVSFDSIRVSLNRQLIIDLLEYQFDKYVKNWSELDKKQFDCFVKYIEEQYSIYLENPYGWNEKPFKMFREWFFDNYDTYDYIDDIENLFEEDN